MRKNSPRPPSPAAGRSTLLFPRHWRVAVGQHAVLEALRTHGAWVEELWLQQGYESSQDLRLLHKEYANKVRKVVVQPEAVLARLAHSHQGAAVLLSRAPELDWPSLRDKKTSCLLLLDGLEDPHNLGAVLRTAWLQAVDGVLLPQDRSVRLSPVVHKVACGGVEHVPVEICQNFSNTIEKLKEMDYWVFGLSHTGPISLLNHKIPARVVWCIGAEDKGLRTTTSRLCDELLHIPQQSAAASYNASVAAAMTLLETYRQHKNLF